MDKGIDNANGLERAERHLTPVVVTIDIKAFFARVLKKELNAKYTFCRIDVVKVLAETAKAVQIEGYFNTNVGANCYCCGAILDTEISKASGIGPVCAKKHGVPRAKAHDAPAIIEFMNQLARTTGKFSTWLPKSQILTPVAWQALAPARAPLPPPTMQKIGPNQIQVAAWLAAKNGHAEVLTVIRKKAETAKWVLVVTDKGEFGIPKSQILQGRV